jgi:hypothetical protein
MGYLPFYLKRICEVFEIMKKQQKTCSMKRLNPVFGLVMVMAVMTRLTMTAARYGWFMTKARKSQKRLVLQQVNMKMPR